MSPWLLLGIFAGVYLAGGLFLVGMYVGERRQARREPARPAPDSLFIVQGPRRVLYKDGADGEWQEAGR